MSPDDDERRVVRDEVLLPERLQLVARDGLVRVVGADLDEPVRMARAEERRHQRPLCHELRGLHAAARATRDGLPADDRSRRPGTPGARRRRPAGRASAGKFLASARVVSDDESIVEPVVSVAPSCATASAICGAVREAVPSSSIAAVKLARPGVLDRVGVAAGAHDQDAQPRPAHPCAARRGRVSPLGSLNSVAVGSASVGIGPAAGGLVAPRLVDVDALGRRRRLRSERLASAPQVRQLLLAGNAVDHHPVSRSAGIACANAFTVCGVVAR